MFKDTFTLECPRSNKAKGWILQPQISLPSAICWIYFCLVDKVLFDKSVLGRWLFSEGLLLDDPLSSLLLLFWLVLWALKFLMVSLRTIDPSRTGPVYDNEPFVRCFWLDVRFGISCVDLLTSNLLYIFWHILLDCYY